MRALVWIMFAGVGLGSSAIASDYVGARRCKTCHPAEYAHWKTTEHARAAKRLSAAERRDPRCAGCHSTSAANGLEGVQCESCHGPGRYYWPEHVMKDAALAKAVGLTAGDKKGTCVSCHTADTASVEPFNFTAALRAVRHSKGTKAP